MHLFTNKTVRFVLIFLILYSCSYSSKTSREMLDASAQNVCDIIIVPGIPFDSAVGINKKNIYTETLAKHSTENIYYGYQKAKQLGFKKIGLATDPFQAKMLNSFVHKKVSPEVVIIPIIFDTLKAMEPQMIDPPIDYSKAYNKDFVPITKTENFWQRMQGTFGNRIDTAAYK